MIYYHLIAGILGCFLGVFITRFILKALDDWRIDRMVKGCKEKRESKDV